MRERDWETSPIGDLSTWPQSLTTLIEVMLGSTQPMFAIWGPERRLPYNDLYARILGDKHPTALGRDYLEVWRDIRAGLEPCMDEANSGRPVHTAEVEHRLHRRDCADADRFSLSFKPVRILGRAADALLQLGVADVTDPEHIPPSRAALAQAIETGHSTALDKQYWRPDATSIWASSSIRRLDDTGGKLKNLLIVTVDLSQRKEAEQRLAESERRLQHLNETLEQLVSERTAERNFFATIVERTDVMVMAVDLDYDILATNKTNVDEFERIYGMRPRVGDNMLDLLSGQPEHQAQLRAGWGRGLAGEEFTFVADFGDAERARPSYEISFRTLRNALGQRTGCYQFVMDVTERLRGQAELAQAQEALRQSQKLEAVGQLTGGVAHDFNNLLTIIRSSVDFLRRPDLPEARKRRYLDAVSETVERAAKLTGQLLAFARRQALKPEVFNVGQRVRGIADMLDTLTGARVQVLTEVPDAPCLIRADLSQFETALVNMAVNPAMPWMARAR